MPQRSIAARTRGSQSVSHLAQPLVAVHGIVVVDVAAGWQPSSVTPAGRASIDSDERLDRDRLRHRLALAVLAVEDAAVGDRRGEPRAPAPRAARRARSTRRCAPARRGGRAGGSRGGSGGRPTRRSKRSSCRSSSAATASGVSVRRAPRSAACHSPSRYSHSPRSRCSPTPSERVGERRPPPPPRAGHRTISVALVTMPSSCAADHALG